MKQLLWIGHRESELFGIENLFTYSITSWGSNKGKNISLNSITNKQEVDKNERTNFFVNTLQQVIKSSDDMIMCYTPQFAYKLIKLCPQLKNHFICLNSSEILAVLNNKIHMRLWLNNKLSLIDYTACFGNECTFHNLHKIFPLCSRFIIQEGISSGGMGTFIFTMQNEKNVISYLDSSKLYLITPFIENSLPVNIHLSIQENEIIIFPGSIQIIDSESDKMLYRGADYIAYKQLSILQKSLLKYESEKMGHILKSLGYRGICGLDFLVTTDKVFFIEINPRFQASTSLLNYALVQNKMPSLQELELTAYNIFDTNYKVDIDKLYVDYSFYKYHSIKDSDISWYKNRISILENNPLVERVFYDGFTEQYTQSDTYLFSAVFKNNIAAITPYSTVTLHPNVIEDNFVRAIIPIKKENDTMIKLKIALLNQGMRILESAQKFLRKFGNYNESTFGSMDIIIDCLRINVPINNLMSSISPFALICKQEKLYLNYYDKTICTVSHEPQRSISNKVTSHGVPYNKIAFISGDRLRIKTENICYFKHIEKSCQFCPNIGKNSSISVPTISLDDIKEVFDYCLDNENFRHIMIGGGSADPDSKVDKILPVINYIRSRCTKDIYIMSIPLDKKRIEEYIKAGVTEFAFNIELIDRDLAAKIMPGKGHIPLEYYLKMLTFASSLLPKESVRSMLMIGLEPSSNIQKGVELLCKHGIQPMLSIFRPAQTCSLNYMVPLSNKEIYIIFKEANLICEKYDISLGPRCASCQNNTVAITKH